MRNSPAWSLSQTPSPAQNSPLGMMMKGLDPVLAPGDPLDPCPWPVSYADNDIWSQYSGGLFSADSDVLHLSQADWQNADLSDSGSWATNSLNDLSMTLSDAPFGQPPLWTPSSVGLCLSLSLSLSLSSIYPLLPSCCPKYMVFDLQTDMS
ncbi:hypothetical protein BDV37DRAFT_57406 [Aspergillus pseudonomiae]|uniref:Uncharacterized protein n=1 Tax=Aspergillus pseudonomiae TaxID=1506151 RepID=A0A5N7DJ57_9EURO|nr:uncharacterized protein BDV37DRAFT_57406 [Aspergillus pseudonomiae]KAE8406482.1 hypothetical protein BDV37DRAFT_57406 [Aspergillus pseudonomiae]